MDFEWNDTKAAANLRKHGVSFEAARLVFDDPQLFEEIDDFPDHGEERWKAIGLAELKLLTVIYTIRDEKIRIISARSANTSEEDGYNNQ